MSDTSDSTDTSGTGPHDTGDAGHDCRQSGPADPVTFVFLGSTLTEVYTFRDEDGTEYLFDVAEGLKRAKVRGRLLDFSPQECGITAGEIRSRYPDIDEARARALPLEALAVPILFVPWKGKHLCIDGWHRILRAVLTGIHVLPAYLLSPADTQQIILSRRPPGEVGPAGNAGPVQSTSDMPDVPVLVVSDLGDLPGARFPMGQLRATPGAAAALVASGDDPLRFLLRHARGDWGRICAEDRAVNDRALRTGQRLLSGYTLSDGTALWIVTEADRSETVLLLPDEY
jgi:hypothetical protein